MAGWGSSDHWSAPHFDVYGFRRSDLKNLADKLGVDLNIPLAEITPSAPEVNNSKPLSGADVEMLRMEIDALKRQIRNLESERPILIKKYREDDPLFLAIQIRNKEWARYDHENDRATRANQASIRHELEEMGFTNRQAESIELVACPIKRG
ncbi:hypothetical protein [Pluralibacter gergoviae]|uniref:hypothetical protein n=1 Tax=Pluralibacter gergoviae TaxID=61647 RepID=UPI001D0FE75D|nr:hypothetical protein [Pluralibacter gergoviae]